MAGRLEDLVLRISADAADLKAELARATSENARATRKIATDWKSVSAGFAGAAGMLGKIASIGGLAGGISFAGLASLAADAEDAADALDKLSQRFGISTTAIQEYRFAAGQAGVEQGELDSALQKAAKSIGEAQLGTGRARTSIAALGVELRDSSGQARSFEAVFEDVVRSLARVENQAQRSALAQRILGGSGAGIAALAGQVDELLGHARGLRVAIDEDVVAALASAQDAGDALSAVLDQRLSKSLLGVSGLVLSAKKEFVDFAETMSNAASSGAFSWLEKFVAPEAISDMRTLDERIKETTEEIRILETKIKSLDAFGRSGSPLARSAIDGVIKFRGQVRELASELTKLEQQKATLAGEKAPITDPIKLDASTLDTAKAKAAAREAAAEAKAAAREVEAAQQRLTSVIEAAFTPAERLTATMDQLGVDYREGKISAEGFAAGQEAIVRQFDEIDEKIQTSALKEIDAIIAAGITPAERLVEQLDRIGQLEREGVGIPVEKLQAARESIEKQFAEIETDPLKDSLKEIESVGASVFEGLTGALSDFILTGQADFASFAQSFASEFLQLSIKAGARSLFAGFGLPGLATGGPAMGGRPYIVGERGPEIFVPSSSGYVVPNTASRGAGVGAAVGISTPAPVFVTVNNSSRASVDVQQRTGPNGAREIEVMVEDIVARSIKRGGVVGRAVSGHVGVRPRGV